MTRQIALLVTLSLSLAPASPALRAGDADKVYTVGNNGLVLQGKVEATDPKVKVIDGDRSGVLPAKLFQVQLIAGKQYRVSMDSKEIDSVLIVQHKTGRQLAWDDDSGGDLNSLLTLDVSENGTYKIYAASLKGSGNFTLKVQEEHVVKGKVHEVGTGLKIAGELGKTQAITYKVKLVAGKIYVIDMISPNQKALDPFLRLLDATGKQLAEDDDGGEGLNARIIHKVETTATFQVVATCFGNGRGPFTLTVRDARDGERALTKEEQERLSRARELNDKAGVLYRAGKLSEALVPALEALAIRKEVLGEKHLDFAMSLGNLALLYNAQGNHAKGGPLIRQTLDIQKEVLGEKHPDYANTLHNLALLYNAQGNPVKAEPLYLQAIEILKESLGEKHPAYTRSLNNLAALYDAQGNHAKAESLYRQVLEINREVLGEKHPDYAGILNNLATFYDAQGNRAKAEALYRQALEIRKEVLGEKHTDYAASLNNLAILSNDQGNRSKAELLFRQVLNINKEVLGEKHPYYAESLNNLATLYKAQGDHAKAAPLFREALEIRKEVLGEKHPAYARALNNLAQLYTSQGDFASAEPLFWQAVGIFKELLGEHHHDYAMSLNNVAFLYASQGNYAKAEPLHQQALVASQVTANPVSFNSLVPVDLRAHEHTVWFLQNHAWASAKGNPKDASRSALRSADRSFLLALTVLERVRQRNLDQQEDRIQLTAERFDLFANRIHVLQCLVALDKKAEDLEAAFRTAEQGTARAFLESLGTNRANLLAGVTTALQTQESQSLQDIRLLDMRIDKESARTSDQRNPDLIGEFLVQRRDAETNLRKLIARIEAQHPQYAGLKYPRPCKLEEARECLSRDEVALLFVPGTDESFIVLVDARPTPRDKANGLAIIELPGAATLAEHVVSVTDTETLGLPARARLLGRQAFEALLGPCKDRIKDKSLVIVPNGSLCFLPFELLVEEDGKFLVEKHRIRYAPSLTALHLINLWKQKRAQPEVPLFAVGDPLYEIGEKVAAAGDSDAVRELLWREGKSGKFKRLVHSGKEIVEIAKLLGAKSEYLMTGEDASEAKVKAASTAEKMAKARYVHFATHGILGADKGKQPALVLNLVGNSGEDGFLEYEEILNLKLNADLVVLSACRTGQGRMARGEGVTGLARAFLYAGSKGVVCSLWSVDDRETANLMVDFYGHLQKGRPAAEALREAQLRMIREGKAPLYWAPFILIGE